MKKFFRGFAAWVRLTRFGFIPTTSEIDDQIQRIADGKPALDVYVNVDYGPPGIYDAGRDFTRKVETHCITRYNLTLRRYELVSYVNGLQYVSWSTKPFSLRALL